MYVNTLVSEEKPLEQQTEGILRHHGRERQSLIPILQEVQEELGYVPLEAIGQIAKFLRLTEVAVLGVATFYNQFRLTPPGKHSIKVCMGTACHMKGGNLIMESWERETGISVGETTPDWELSLERVACVGCCTLAPVAVVDDTVHGRVSTTRVKGLLLALAMQKERDSQAGAP